MIPGIALLFAQSAPSDDGPAPLATALLPLSSDFLDVMGAPVIVSGAPVISSAQAKFGETSAYLSGEEDLILLPSSPDYMLTGDFTFEFWFRPDAYPDNYKSVFSCRTSYRGLLMYANPEGRFEIVVNGSYFASSQPYTPGVWTHFAVSQKGGFFRMFFNGVLVGSMTPNPTEAVDPEIRIGYDEYSGGPVLPGFYQDFCFINGLGLYTANFTPPTAPFQTG